MVVYVVNRQSSKWVRVMCLVRVFMLQSLRINDLFFVRHVSGFQNGVADALSHFQGERFRQLVPSAQLQPDPMPPWLWNLGL